MLNLVAYREKTDVIRDDWAGGDVGQRVKVALRSNRVVMPYKHQDGESQIVIRGKTLPAALMMTCSVMEHLNKAEGINEPEVIEKIQKRYKESLSEYQRNHVVDNWITVYVDGYKLLGESKLEEIDHLEDLAKGELFNEEILRQAEEKYQLDSMMMQMAQDSQVSMIVTKTENGYRTSILERSVRADGKFQFTVQREDRRDVVLAAVASASYIYEASTLLSLCVRLREQSAQKKGTEADKQERVMLVAAQSAAEELRNRIVAATRRYKLYFWPEEPDFISGSVASYLSGSR